MSTAGRSGTRVFVFVSVVVALLMTVDWFTAGAIRHVVRPALTPIATFSERVVQALEAQEFWKTRTALLNEVSMLKEELTRREMESALLSALESENTILRSLVGFSDTGVTVPITSSFSSSPYGTFTIGGGSSHGIEGGDIVIAREGFVLGTVTDVALHSAIVRAVFAPGVDSDVVAGDVGFSVSGRGGGNALAQVPREAPLSTGAPVIAPFLDNRPVGVIGNIESASSSAFADVYVHFPFNPNSLRFVTVVKRQ